MTIAIAIISARRPTILHETVRELVKQTRLADEVLIIPPTAAPGESIESHVLPETIALPYVRICPGPWGLCQQRNVAIDSTTSDVLIFFDDDLVLDPHYLENAERILNEHPEAVGLGGKVLADGSMENEAISRERALTILSEYKFPGPVTTDMVSFYGCNMVVKTDIARAVRFDEMLQGYCIFDDRDFGNRVKRLGRLIHTNECRLVHLATRSGRTSPVKFGLAQIRTPVHCWRKGSFSGQETRALIANCVAANLMGLVRPYKGKTRGQRLGQLAGNLKGVAYAFGLTK